MKRAAQNKLSTARSLFYLLRHLMITKNVNSFFKRKKIKKNREKFAFSIFF